MIQHDAPTTGAQVSGGILLLLVAGGTVAGATQTDETGPILAFVGALLVVLITAVTTDRRQRRQIAAEGSRHTETLTTQSGELRRQLAHDRKLADLQHLRALLDSCAAAHEESSASCIAFAVALRRDPGTDDAPVLAVLERRRDRYTRSYDAARRIEVETRRLEMRYPVEHPICATFIEVHDAAVARFRFLSEVEDGKTMITSEQDEEDTKNGVAMMVAFEKFAAAVRSSIGAQIDEATRRHE